ncbi:VOC family protein [Blastococcus sp. SYSU D00820]
MALSLDVVGLPVPDVDAACVFYRSAFSFPVREAAGSIRLDLRGAGQLELQPADGPATAGAGGRVLNLVVAQPSEVEALVAAAARHGATVLKPAKKGFFGGFTAVVRAPDGTVWKLAAPTKKDTGPAADPPVPTEVVTILGVARPKVSAAFYTALGMTVDRDYGTTFVDFRFRPGSVRLGLMPGRELAKDAGTDLGDAGSAPLVCRAGSADEVDALLAAVAPAGGRIVAPAAELPAGGHGGRFTDPDGFPWSVASG